MSPSFPHATVAGPKRKYVPRPPKRLYATGWRREASTRKSAIVRGNSRRRADGIERDRVCRSFDLRGLFLGHQLRELEVAGEMRGDGCADETAGVLDHECHFLGGHVFGGDYEVSFVFARGRVQDYDKVTASLNRRSGQPVGSFLFVRVCGVGREEGMGAGTAY